MKKPSIYLKTFSLMLSVGLVMSASAMAIAGLKPNSSSQENQKPSETLVTGNKGLRFTRRRMRASRRRTGGFSRGVCKIGDQEKQVNVTALLPQLQSKELPDDAQEASTNEQIPVELTVEQTPTFFVHITETEAEEAVFTLMTENKDKVVYETTISLDNQTPGIVSISIPESDPADPENELLQVDQIYNWFVTIPCDQNDWSQNPTAEGWVQRIAKEESLKQELAKTPDIDHPKVFVDHGVWTEAVSSLAKLRERYPNNPQVQADWKDLLASVGLENLVAERPVNSPE
ncbi:DUF928 domain-containing protein [Coleofasciculus chthonoplastes]|uniref:DUF928 domain-containing protein n=1 Tax=Coleofasciculus chthonoplastes TaxID=64178 RepID=UPI0032FE25A6